MAGGAAARRAAAGAAAAAGGGRDRFGRAVLASRGGKEEGQIELSVIVHLQFAFTAFVTDRRHQS